MRSVLRLGVLAVVACAVATPGLADGKHKERYKYEYRENGCKVEVKYKDGRYKEERDCDRRGEYSGGPPPWAPAHGWRRKHERRAQPAPAPSLPAPIDFDLGLCNREVVGSLIGGALGGLAGSQFGKGDGKVVATASGTLLGFLIGGAIGRDMDRVDQNCVGQALESAPDGEVISWTGPRGDFAVQPVATWQEQGRYCREYVTRARIGGHHQEVFGKACRQPDGAWEILS